MNLTEKIVNLKIKFPAIDIDDRIKIYSLTHTHRELEAKIDLELSDKSYQPTSFYTLRVGYECNNYCIHCFVDDKRYHGGDRTFQEITRIIDSIENQNTLIIITGGEPTIRDDLLDILKYIKYKGFESSIQTNGLKFHDMKYLESVAPYIEGIVLPIHSNNEQIFDKITRVDGSYQKIIQGFKNLVKFKINVTTQTVINQLNYKTILSTYDMIQSIKPDTGMTLTFPHPVGAANTIDVVPSYKDIAQYLLPVAKKYGHLMHTHYIPKCFLYPYHHNIVVIDETDNGNVIKPGIDYINGEWKNIDFGKFGNNTRVKSIECKKCIFNNECVGVWKEYSVLYPNLNENLIPIKKDDLKEINIIKNNISDLIDMFNDNKTIDIKIKDIILHSYYSIRDNPEIIDTVTEMYSMFLEYIFSNENIQNKVSSVFTTNTKLQYKLDREYIDKFLNKIIITTQKRNKIDKRELFRIIEVITKVRINE